MAETDSPVTTSLTTSMPVLNISGTLPSLPGKKICKKAATKEIDQPKSEPAKTININTFPVILSKILLKCDEAPNNPPNDKCDEMSEFLCVAIFKNEKTRTLTHHMFLSIYKNMDEECEKVKKLYENKKDLKYKNRETMHSICVRSLYRSVQKDLKEFKWNKAGNAFETPMERETDEWLYRRFRDLEIIEMEKLFNYIKFLSISKQ